MSDLAAAAMGADGSNPESQGSQSTTSPDSGSVGDDSGVQAPAWMGQLPDNLKGSEKLTQFAKLGDLGNAFLELDGRLANSIEVPGEGATDEQKQAFRQKLGVPADPKEYALKDVEDLPDLGEKFNGTKGPAAEWMQGVAHENGLTPEQASGVFKSLVERTKVQLEEGEKARNTAAEATRQVFQNELKDRYEPTMKRANALIKEFGGQEYFDLISENGMANDPRQIRFIMKLASVVGDGAIPGGEASGKKPFESRGPGGLPNMGYKPEDFKRS